MKKQIENDQILKELIILIKLCRINNINYICPRVERRSGGVSITQPVCV